MKREIQVDPIFKLFAFGSKGACFFESLAVHPDGYLYLEPIINKDTLTFNHAVSSSLTRFDSDYLYRTLNRTSDLSYRTNLGFGVIVYPTPNARLNASNYQRVYEV